MKVTFNNNTMQLEETPLDIGYASDEVCVTNEEEKEFKIAGHTGFTQLIITAPFIDDSFNEELKEIAKMVEEAKNNNQEHKIQASLIVANNKHQNPNIKEIDFYIDSKKEFGDWYGLRLKGTPLEDEFTKSLMVVSKEGTIFYDDFVKDILDPFNKENLYRKIVASQLCYTGEGCH